MDNGYVAAARTAEEEAGISLSKIDVADNIDMASILQDYEEFVQQVRSPSETDAESERERWWPWRGASA